MTTCDREQTEPAWPTAVSVPANMRAVTIREFGGVEVLQMETIATPVVKSGEVLVRVAAVSVGAALDVAARAGKHPFGGFKFPHVLGAECAGTVVEVGAAVNSDLHGRHVAIFPVIVPEKLDAVRPELSGGIELIGTHRPGSYAEYVAVPASNVRIVPETLSPVDATSVVLAGAVAMNQFGRVGGIGPGHRVVVIGGASALGSTTALLAQHLGADVVVTSRSATKRARLEEHGITAVDGCLPDVVEQIRFAFGGLGAHVVIDNLGLEDSWSHHLEMLEPGGSLVCSGAVLGGRSCLDARQIYLRGLTIYGVRTADIASLDRLWAEVEAGFSRGVVDRVFALDDVAEAHRWVEGGENVGRVLLSVPS